MQTVPSHHETLNVVPFTENQVTDLRQAVPQRTTEMVTTDDSHVALYDSVKISTS